MLSSILHQRCIRIYPGDYAFSSDKQHTSQRASCLLLGVSPFLDVHLLAASNFQKTSLQQKNK
jgi:hypothetical protein